jgi:cytochrome b
MHKTDDDVYVRSMAQVNVWDLPIRLFHWLLVFGVTIAYASARYRLGTVHALTGYGLCILLSARIIWGFIGSKYARFDSFAFSRGETVEYLRGMLRGNPGSYLGHNPAGALMVFILLVVLALLLLTGLLTLAAIDFDGPLAVFANNIDDATSYEIRHLHALLTNVSIALVVLHVAGVVWGSIQHKENLVKAMLTGKKRMHVIEEFKPGIEK